MKKPAPRDRSALRRVAVQGLGLGLILWLGACAHAPMQADADARFARISGDEFEWRRTLSLPDPSEPRPGAQLHLPDVGEAAQAERERRWVGVERELDALPVASLSPAVRTDYEVYRGQIDALLASQRQRDFEAPFNSDSSFWAEVAALAERNPRSADEARAYVALLDEVPRYFDQQIANMRLGLARGFTPPRVSVQGREQGVARVAAAPSATETVFYGPLRHLPASMSEAEQAQLRADAEKVISGQVIPAHARLLAFLRDQYLPQARQTIAARDLPSGEAYYRSKIREFTTLDLAPGEIHEIGLAELAAIRARMEQTMREAGHTGDLASFLQMLRTDPRFYVSTPQALLDRAAWIAKSFDARAAQWFGHLPRSRFAIRPVPVDIAPYYTAGRGGPGVYLVNTYDLPSRPLYSLVALTLHESAPGHAFQMPLAAENDRLPAFRRETYLSGYGEGWALYCEVLGEEMGMYETPYERFGMLSYQAWRASRLVVDTGLHDGGWTREQAQRFLHDNTALSDHEIETEVDRYIAWPGQALSYYLGERAIRADRARAEQALGARFNIRAFHDLVLSLGPVPLPLLDRKVDEFIAGGGVGPYPAEE